MTTPTKPQTEAPPRPAPPTARAPTPKQRRRPRMIGLGIALVLLFSLLGVFLFTQGSTPKTVVVTDAQIDGGQPVKASQLTTTQISGGDNSQTIPQESLQSLEGNLATGDIPAGTILSPDMLATKTRPDSGQTIVGARLKPGNLPAGGVSSGDQVTVLITAPEQAGGGGSSDSSSEGGGEDPAPTGKAWEAEVITAGKPGDDGSVTVDLALSSAAAREVGVANGTGRLSVLLDSTLSGE